MQKDNAPSKEDNIFDEYYELLSESEIKGGSDGVNLKSIKSQLSAIEKSLNETLFKEPEFWNSLFYKILYASLKKFLVSFKITGFEYRLLYLGFAKYLSYLSLLSKHSIRVNEDETFDNFNQFFPVSEFYAQINPDYEFDLNPPSDYQGIERFEDSLGRLLGIDRETLRNNPSKNGEITIFCNNYEAIRVKWSSRVARYVPVKKLHYLTLELIYDKGSREINLDNFALSLYFIISGLKQLPRTYLEILDIRKGSVRVKGRLWMEDDEAKKSAQDLLQGAKDSASANNIEDLMPSIALPVQGEFFEGSVPHETSLELTPSQRRKFIDNQLERERLMNESLRLQNAKASLEILKMSHEIVGQGFSTPKNIEAIINHALFFRKIEGDVIETDEDIKDIT